MGKKHDDGISKIKVSMLKQTSMSLKTELLVAKNQVAEVRKEN